MKNHSPLLRTAVIALAGMMLLSMLPVAAGADKANDTFIYAIEGDPGNDINVISTSSRYDLMAERMVYSPLFDYFAPDDIVYLLAESIDVSDDLMTITAHLREGVLWHDGEPFTADDVVFTYEMVMKYEHSNGYDGLVYNDKKTEVVKIDDYTVEFRLPVVNAAILELLVAEHYIMPKHIYEGDESVENNEKNASPVGTGPYKWAEYKAGQYVRFEANENYFRGEPQIGAIIFQIISDKNAVMLALKKGEVDAMVIDNASAVDFEGSSVTLYAYPEDRVGYMSFNMSSENVRDINFRKACMFALNRDELNVAAYLSEEFYVNAYSFLPAAAVFATSDVERYDHSVETAKEYLAKAEHVPELLKIAYTVNNPVQETEALVIQQNLKEIGVNVELQGTDGTALFVKMQDKDNTDYDMYLSGYIMGTDPMNYATLFRTDSASNYSHMSDARLDELFTAGVDETDIAVREALYVEAQQRLADLAVQYPIVTNMRLLGVVDGVGGIDEARLIPIYTFQDMSKLFFH